jgi:hypothetical protein
VSVRSTRPPPRRRRVGLLRVPEPAAPFGTSFIPHFGQRSGFGDTTSGCIGQVKTAASLAGFARFDGLGAGAETGAAVPCPS